MSAFTSPSMSSADPFGMRTHDFEMIRQMVYEFCGVDLSGKQVLVGTRLGKKVRDLGFTSFRTYCEHIRQDKDGALFAEMIDALTTNHTSFFREEQHFRFLKEVLLPELPPHAPLSIWSAACSSGEEPYTIAFSMVDALGDAAFSRASILATDISTRVLEKARQGLYPLDRVRNIPQHLLRRCWMKGTGRFADQCLVKPEVRALIQFHHFNLLEDCSGFGPFQVIFCRNVMIYFDQPTQEALVNRLANRLLPGGYLFIGHSESLNGVQHPLQYVAPAIYCKSGPGVPRIRNNAKLWKRAQ